MLGIMIPMVGFGFVIGVSLLISNGLETLLGDVFVYGVVPSLGVLTGYDLSSSV